MAGRKGYTDEQVASALAVLAAEGGCVAAASRVAGVPYTTMNNWAKGRRRALVSHMGEAKRASLAESVEGLASLLVGDLSSEPARKNAAFKDLAVALGIAVDKLLLLKGLPNAITDTTHRPDLSALSDEDVALAASLAERLASLGNAPGVPGNPGP